MGPSAPVVWLALGKHVAAANCGRPPSVTLAPGARGGRGRGGVALARTAHAPDPRPRPRPRPPRAPPRALSAGRRSPAPSMDPARPIRPNRRFAEPDRVDNERRRAHLAAPAAGAGARRLLLCNLLSAPAPGPGACLRQACRLRLAAAVGRPARQPPPGRLGAQTKSRVAK